MLLHSLAVTSIFLLLMLSVNNNVISYFGQMTNLKHSPYQKKKIISTGIKESSQKLIWFFCSVCANLGNRDKGFHPVATLTINTDSRLTLLYKSLLLNWIYYMDTLLKSWQENHKKNF